MASPSEKVGSFSAAEAFCLYSAPSLANPHGSQEPREAFGETAVEPVKEVQDSDVVMGLHAPTKETVVAYQAVSAPDSRNGRALSQQLMKTEKLANKIASWGQAFVLGSGPGRLLTHLPHPMGLGLSTWIEKQFYSGDQLGGRNSFLPSSVDWGHQLSSNFLPIP